MRKKILHLLKTSEYSGAENVVCQIIKLYERDNFEMIYSSPSGAIEKALEHRQIEYIPMQRFKRKSLIRNLRENHISLIHAHDPGACVLAAISSRIPIIAHVHGNHDNMKILSLKSLLFLLASIRFKKIIWVSESALKEYFFYKLVKRKSVVLINVINGEEVRRKADSPVQAISDYDVIYLGRLSEEKDPLKAIRVMHRVTKTNSNYRFVIVGDGILRNKCEDLVKDLHMQSNIEFKGFVENPYPILKHSSVLLISSKYEGTPMNALEAMCLGKPIVSTPTDGLLKLIKFDKTGYYSGDEKKMASFLFTLLSDENKREEMSRNAEKEFDRINDLTEYKRKLLLIYKECGI